MKYGMRRASMAGVVSLSLYGPGVAKEWWLLQFSDQGRVVYCVPPGKGLTPYEWYAFLDQHDFSPDMKSQNGLHIVTWKEQGKDGSLMYTETREECEYVATYLAKKNVE